MPSLTHRKCIECGKEFQGHHNDRRCSPECRAKARRLARCVGASTERKKKPRPGSPLREPRPCEICGDIYKPNSSNQRACSRVECRRAVGGAMTVDSEVPCVICGTVFLAKVGSYRKTCANPACEFKLNSQTQHSNREREKNAPPKPPPYGMPCPWQTGKLDYLPSEVTTWDCAEMDPLSCGTARVALKIEMKQERRRAA